MVIYNSAHKRLHRGIWSNKVVGKYIVQDTLPGVHSLRLIKFPVNNESRTGLFANTISFENARIKVRLELQMLVEI
jgi:hypothetical protein